MGGDCLNVGCVPSKSLLEFTAKPDASFDGAYEWMRGVRAAIAAHDSVERYTQAGVDVFLGPARFVAGDRVAVGSAELEARRIVIATGARASLPRIAGLADSRPLTNESIFDLESQPARLAVLGAGPIGCELAQAFARLGTVVDVFEAADRILVNESATAAAVVSEALVASGVRLHTSAGITGVARRGSQVAITTTDEELSADQLLVAAGRIPNTDELNLAGAGVATDAGGHVIVDSYLRSTNRKVYAAGDVCTALKFTHHADAHARIVVQNSLFFASRKIDRLVVPRCVYTSPELAQVGATEHELELDERAFDRYRVEYAELDRGRTQGDDTGFIELLVEHGGKKILGATIVGQDAGEQLAPVCYAMAHGNGIDSFDRVLLPYPTRAETLRNLATQYNKTRLTPRARAWFDRWFRWSL